MPHENCCLCSKRIPSNIKKKNKVGQPKLWKSFQKYVKNSGRTYQPQDFICKRCENKIQNLNGKDHGISAVEPMEWTFDNVDSEFVSSSDPETLPQNDADISNSELSGPFSEVVQSASSQENSQNITMSVTENSQLSSLSSSQASSFAQSQNSSINPHRMPEFIIPGIATCIKTQSYCFICRNPRGRWRIPKSALMDAWLTRRIRIPNENRCCRNHLENGVFTKNALININAINEDMESSGEEIAQWILELTDEANKSNSTVDFSPLTSLTSADYEMLLGVSKDNFAVLFGYLKDTVRNSINRTAHDALAIFLMKLRLNLSQRVIAFLFGITNQSVISETIEIVSKALEEKFVPQFLGYHHLSREEVMNRHMRPFFTKVLGLNDDDMILILDGTYLYVQKASDFKLQRQTFSLHKHRNLFKPMMIVCPDGYILEADGLYFADAGNNDAKILNRILDQPDSLLSILQERDALVLDRGFRDILETVERAGLTSFMPSLLHKNSKQFTTLEANQSRKVTMLRWVVEAANGRLKNKFRFFDSVIPVSYFPRLNTFFRVAVAIINAFSPPLFTETADHQKLADVALKKMESSNRLQEKIESENLDKRSIATWREQDANLLSGFPTFNLEDLKQITLGPYQVSMGKLYNLQHTEATGSGYQISIHKEEDGLIRVKLQSRFSKRTTHLLWISYEEEGSGVDSILGWYCRCKVGSRTVGCCSHIAAVLRHLAHDRFHPPSAMRDLASGFLDAAAQLAAEEDSGDESQDAVAA